jgi:hypothetical protein
MLMNFCMTGVRWLAGLMLLGVLSCWSTAQAQIRIVAIGDSQIAGKGVSSSEAYPAKLEAALRARGQNVVVINAGINGDTTSGVLARLDSSVPNGTSLVIVSVGANDVVLHGVSPAQVAVNLNAIKRRLAARGIETLILPYGRALQGNLFDKPDYHVEKVRVPGKTEWHLNSAGYDVVVARTLPQVMAALSRAKSSKQRQPVSLQTRPDYEWVQAELCRRRLATSGYWAQSSRRAVTATQSRNGLVTTDSVLHASAVPVGRRSPPGQARRNQGRRNALTGRTTKIRPRLSARWRGARGVAVHGADRYG